MEKISEWTCYKNLSQSLIIFTSLFSLSIATVFADDGSSSHKNTKNKCTTANGACSKIQNRQSVTVNNTTAKSGAYTANISAANRMFMQSSDHNYIKNKKVWLDLTRRKLKTHQLNGLVHAKDNMSIMQMGSDLFAGTFTTRDTWKIGIMGGYGQANIKNHSKQSSVDSSVKGYAAGFYAGWKSNGEQKDGFDIIGSVQYSRYKNSIDNIDAAAESYHSDGLIVGGQAGYGMYIYESEESKLLLKPHVQVHWSTVEADDHKDISGENVTQCNKGFVITRSGIGLYSNNKKFKNSNVTINPFLETDLFTFSDECALFYSDERIEQDKSKTAGQIKLGASSYIGKDFSLNMAISHLKGSHGYQQKELNLGARWSF